MYDVTRYSALSTPRAADSCKIAFRSRTWPAVFKASFEDLQDLQHHTQLVCTPTGTRTRGEGPLRWWVSDRAFKVPATSLIYYRPLISPSSYVGRSSLGNIGPIQLSCLSLGFSVCGLAMLQYSHRVDAQCGCGAVRNVKSNPIRPQLVRPLAALIFLSFNHRF